MPASYVRAREGTEWSTAYWYNVNDHQLPRVLLIGDSICNGYQSLVKDKLAGTAYVTFWASSKCVTDETYLKALSFLLGECKYDVIHFNNGLHSLGTDRAAWEQGLRAAFELLQKEGQGAKLIWCTSTPLKVAEMTEQAKELNAIAAKVNQDFGFAVDDLFALMDPQDRDELWSDTFHYKGPGREMQAQQIADLIKPMLADWKAPAQPAAAPGTPAGEVIPNADFEGKGGWMQYPPKTEAGSFEMTTDGVHGGDKCAKVTVLTGGYQFYQYKPNLAAGQSYTMKFWAKADQPQKVQVHVRTQKPPYVTYGNKTVDVTADWQEFSTTIELPAVYDKNAHVLFFNLLKPGTYYLDDITFEQQ